MGSETRIRGDDNHVQAIRGLWDSGFLAASHGAPNWPNS